MRGSSWALALLALALGCADAGTAAPSADSAGSARASAAASGALAPAPTASASAAVNARAVSKALARGRELAAAGKWAEAAAAFEQVVAGDPAHAVGQSELGWARLQTGELDAAETATKRGLELTSDPKLRASLLYNQGRISEARGDLAAAKLSYQGSLALRPNESVSKRLESLGGEKPGPAPAPPPALPCKRAFATVKAACDCLVGELGALGLEGTAARCEAAAIDSPGQSRPLELVRISAEGASVHYVLVDVAGRLWPSAAIKGGVKIKKVLSPRSGDATVASVMFDRSDEKGLRRTTSEVLCVLAGREGAPACPLEIVLAVSELSDGKANSDRSVTLSRGFKSDTEVVVKRQAGPEDLVPRGAIGTFTLPALRVH